MKWFKGLLIISALLFAGSAFAATTPNSVITTQTPNLGVVQFLQGTDTAGTYKTIYTAGTNGSKVTGLFAASNDASAAHLVTCQLVRSTVKYGGTAVNVPANSGFTSGTPQVNMMAAANWVGLPIDSDGNPFVYMVSGDTLQCTFATTLTTSDSVSLLAVAADF